MSTLYSTNQNTLLSGSYYHITWQRSCIIRREFHVGGNRPIHSDQPKHGPCSPPTMRRALEKAVSLLPSLPPSTRLADWTPAATGLMAMGWMRPMSAARRCPFAICRHACRLPPALPHRDLCPPSSPLSFAQCRGQFWSDSFRHLCPITFLRHVFTIPKLQELGKADIS